MAVIYGTSGSDMRNGTSEDDEIYGWAEGELPRTDSGDDTLNGWQGHDKLFGGPGNDTLLGSSGRDQLSGGLGDDRLFGSRGRDFYFGGDGNDYLFKYYKDSFTDVFDGGDGIDLLEFSIRSGPGSIEFFMEDINAVVPFGYKGMTVTGVEQFNLRLANGSDRISLAGTSYDNTVDSLGGSDSVVGGSGRDTLNGGPRDDILHGGAGDDNLAGEAGSDTLNGDDGDDVLAGGKLDDILSGDAGADTFLYLEDHDHGDVILDYVQGEDMIAFEDEARGTDGGMTYIGQSAFSGDPGEIRSVFVGDDTAVRVDTDGDGSSDIRFIIRGHVDLTAADFGL